MRFRAVLIVLAVLAMLAAACGSDEGETTTTAAAGGGTETTAATETTTGGGEEAGGVLKVARFESFDGWVLDSAAAYASYQTHLAVMEPLLRFGADGVSLEPGLAKEWDYDPDGPTMTFVLQDDARFSNGEPVTAEDVAFSLEVWRAGPNFGLSWDAIEAVTGEGNTVVIELAYPDNTVLPLMASSVSGIMPKDFAGMTEDEFYNAPIGAGAFTVEEWSQGGRIVLTPNEYFYDAERPYADEVVIDVVADETERQILFEGGEADIVEYLSPTVAPQYDPASVYSCTVHSVEHVGLNVLRPPFDDVAVRQAVAYAIDYQAISDALGQYFDLPSGILAPNIWNWVPPTKEPYRQDLAKARDLLAGSTAPDGASVELIYDVGNDLDTLISQIIQANLAEIGFDVSLTSLETGAFLDRAFSIDADMTIWNYGAIQPDMGDPMNWIIATGWLFSGFETDTLFEQFLEYAGAATEEEQEAIVAQIQDDAIDNAAAIPLAEGSYLHAVNPNLVGFESAPWGLYYWDTISFGG
jgi:peptide/nickel transport system substrate-binding protein